MKSTANIDQHYAFDAERNLIYIKNAQRNVKFTCVNCGGEMIAKQGKVREWHFAHKTLSENCSHESYLHSLAKIKIHDWFYNTDNFILGLNTEYRCSQIKECIWFDNQNYDYCILNELCEINLKEFYNSCDIERAYMNFRADLFLYNNQFEKSPVFIEICVNHPCSKEKINSGIRIIEVIIKSEEDIDSIIFATLYEGNDRIRLYNFNPKAKKTYSRYKELNKFLLYKEDKGFYNSTDCRTYTGRNPKSIFELTMVPRGDIMDYSMNEIGWATAYKYKYPVRNCFVCKYHRNNPDRYMCDVGDEALPIFCCCYIKLGTNKYCKSTKAIECRAFTVDKELCDAIEKKMRTAYAEIWERNQELPT